MPTSSSCAPTRPSGAFCAGLAKDFLTTLYLATPAPMWWRGHEREMWAHPAMQANLRYWQIATFVIVPPGVGDLSFGMIGPAVLSENRSNCSAVT